MINKKNNSLKNAFDVYKNFRDNVHNRRNIIVTNQKFFKEDILGYAFNINFDIDLDSIYNISKKIDMSGGKFCYNLGICGNYAANAFFNFSIYSLNEKYITNMFRFYEDKLLIDYNGYNIYRFSFDERKIFNLNIKKDIDIIEEIIKNFNNKYHVVCKFYDLKFMQNKLIYMCNSNQNNFVDTIIDGKKYVFINGELF